MAKRPKIAFVTLSDPRSRRTWSGTYYYMQKSLQAHCGDVVCLGPVDTCFDRLGALVNYAARKVAGRSYGYQRSRFMTNIYATKISKRLKSASYDLVFAPAAAPAIASLSLRDIPIVAASDTTFALVHEYYSDFSQYLPRSIRDANTTEQRALDRATLALYPSDWAATSAIADYHIPASKVAVIPFGANLDAAPPRSAALSRKPSGECRLLFLGVDWERKGGDIAYQTMLRLGDKYGVHARLAVAGCHPPVGLRHDRLKMVGFLDKNNPEDAGELYKLFQWADYLFVPTRKECFGIVFCEASAFGLPSVTTDTGGVKSAVRHGENGLVLPETAGPDDYADLIYQVESEPDSYADLVVGARTAYETRLNWDAWARRLRQLVDISW